MTIPPRYTGANTFAAEDSTGNVFYIYQGPSDSGCCVMIEPGGASRVVLSTPANSGRASLDCNPLVGLWLVGNRETPATQPPPRYPIAEYVPWPAPAGSGLTLLPAPVSSSAWNGRALSGGALVDVPAVFGVASAEAYLVRLCGQAGVSNVKVRAGTELAPYFLTLVTQFPNVRMDTQGWVPGPLVYISTFDGNAQVWLQVLA